MPCNDTKTTGVFLILPDEGDRRLPWPPQGNRTRNPTGNTVCCVPAPVSMLIGPWNAAGKMKTSTTAQTELPVEVNDETIFFPKAPGSARSWKRSQSNCRDGLSPPFQVTEGDEDVIGLFRLGCSGTGRHAGCSPRRCPKLICTAPCPPLNFSIGDSYGAVIETEWARQEGDSG